MFDGLLYPDNENRATRAGQLANDCEHALSQLGSQKAELEKALSAANAAMSQVASLIDSTSFKPVPVTVARSWLLDVPGPLAGILANVVLDRALQQAFTRVLLSQGRIGEAAFTRLVGLPRWFKVGKFGGSAAGATVIALLVQLGIDAFGGANQRSKLQSAIGDLATPRFQLTRATRTNGILISSLNGLTIAYNAFRDSLNDSEFDPDKNVDNQKKEKMLKAFTDKSMSCLKEKIAAVTADSILKELQSLDHDRKSWTDEDRKPDTATQPPALESAVLAAIDDHGRESSAAA